MRSGRSFVRALVVAQIVVFLLLVPGIASAQQPGSPLPTPTETESPRRLVSPAASPKGVCAPWHRCVAFGVFGAVGLWLAFVGMNYMIQRRGFDTVEHRQGSPEGVKVGKE